MQGSAVHTIYTNSNVIKRRARFHNQAARMLKRIRKRQSKRMQIAKYPYQCRKRLNSDSCFSSPLLFQVNAYIRELKGRITHLNAELHKQQRTRRSTTSSTQHRATNNNYAVPAIPNVRVVTLQHGSHILQVTCKKSPGLLISLLECMDNIGLVVSDASVSCHNDTFTFDAIAMKIGTRLSSEQLQACIFSILQYETQTSSNSSIII